MLSCVTCLAIIASFVQPTFFSLARLTRSGLEGATHVDEVIRLAAPEVGLRHDLLEPLGFSVLQLAERAPQFEERVVHVLRQGHRLVEQVFGFQCHHPQRLHISGKLITRSISICDQTSWFDVLRVFLAITLEAAVAHRAVRVRQP